MWNKSLLKLGLTFLALSILIMGYKVFMMWNLCSTLGGCDGDFGRIMLIQGMPALMLLVYSLVLILTSRFYRKDISKRSWYILLIIGIMVFAFPYVFAFFWWISPIGLYKEL